MIFTLEHCKMIVKGTKTQECKVDFGGIKWQVGRDYAVQGEQGRKGLYRIGHELMYYDDEMCLYLPYSRNRDLDYEGLQPFRIRITAIDLMDLWDLDEDDYQREGGYTPEAFYDLWDDTNPKHKWDTNPQIWRLQFEVV